MHPAAYLIADDDGESLWVWERGCTQDARPHDGNERDDGRHVGAEVRRRQARQLRSLRADVSHREIVIITKFTLEGEMPLLSVGRPQCLLRQRVGQSAVRVLEKELADERNKVFGRSAELIARPELITRAAANQPDGRDRIVVRVAVEHEERGVVKGEDAEIEEGRVNVNRDFVGEDVARLADDRTEDCVEVDAVAAAQGHSAFGVESPCETEAWPKVVAVRVVDSRAPVQNSVVSTQRGIEFGGASGRIED